MSSKKTAIKKRLEYLRQELRAERISYSELAELQGLAKYIEPGDVELAEAAGIPEEEFAKRSSDKAGGQAILGLLALGILHGLVNTIKLIARSL